MKPINRAYMPEVGMALATKEGQHAGNAFILAKESVPDGRENCAIHYTILTDFGNTFKLLPSGIVQMYDVANWWWVDEELHLWGVTLHHNHRSPKQRIERQVELLTEVLRNLEDK